MKTNTAPRNVSVAASQSSTFSISNNAKIFRILIDGLYADKIQSITREIWSNALDAHTQAGCADRPFDVSFPNPFDPTFRVRDYGISLTHDQVMFMYTDLGHSTKEDTNDAIGKFGIGSKSPFAYTDNFTVTVYLDGTARFYSAMIGSDGVPAIHLMGEQPTDEENGVEVAFPVEASDTSAFQNAAKRVSHGFAVKPNVINMPEFSGWPELPLLLEGDGWKLLKGCISGYQEKAYARMGPVLYPINANALGDLTSEQKEILGYTFVIDFEMGDLEITASREELSYGRNDPTTASILSKVNEVLETLTQRCIEDFEECETYFDACTKYREQIMSNQIPNAVRQIVREKAEWRGQKLTNQIDVSAKNRGWDLSYLENQKLGHTVYRFSTTYSTKVSARKDTIIMLEDLTGGKKIHRASTRIKSYVSENRQSIDQVLWVRIYDTRPCQSELINFFGDFDGAEIIHVDSLPEPVRASGQKGPRMPVMARVLSYRNFDTKTEITDEQFEAGGIYVPLERMQPVVPAGNASPGHLVDYLNHAGASVGRVIGAPKSMWKKFEGDQWVNLYDYARKWFNDQDVDFEKVAAHRRAVEIVENDSVLNFMQEHCDTAVLTSNSTALEVNALLCLAQEDETPNLRPMKNLAAALSISVPDMSDLKPAPMMAEYEETMQAIRETYPMMELLAQSNVSYYDTALDKVTEYVIMCDNVSKTNHPSAIAA